MTTTGPTYALWLTKQNAAEIIGCSTKTIEQLAKSGQIQQAQYKRPETGARISVYHPDDVERVRKERNPEAQPFIVPAGSESAPSTALVRGSPPAVSHDAVAEFAAFLKALADSRNTENPAPETIPPVPLAQRAYLTIPEAAAFTGLSETCLRRRIKEGAVEVLKGAGPKGASVVRRADLEWL